MTPSHSTKPSLDKAYARVRRSEYHLTHFKQLTIKFFSSGISGLANVEGRADVERPYINLTFPEIPEIFPILVGEIIYNLRAALDYLIYELSLLDSKGKIDVKAPQFLIEDSPEGWRRHKWRLKFLQPEHQSAIKRLQPFNGCCWTATLRDLSDPDKHRSLSAVVHQAVLLFETEDDTNIPVSEAEDVAAPFQVTRRIEFDDGSPVEETLHVLQSNSAGVLDSFAPEFTASK